MTEPSFQRANADSGIGRSDPSRPTLSIVIPVYNELNTIRVVLDQVVGIPLSKEIIVVNDGSTDGTGELLERLKDELGLSVINHSSNSGKGAAVRKGLERVRGEIVVIQDADLELDPTEIPKLVEPIQEGRAEVVYGSRFLLHGKWGQVPGLPFVAWLGNRALTAITNLLYGSRLTDMETCYKVCRAPVIARISLECMGFELEPELTAKLLRLGYRIHELPIDYRPRTRTSGKKIKWSDGVKAVVCLLKYRFKDVETFERREGSPLRAGRAEE